MSNGALVLIASVIIIGNFISLYLFRWVHKNKYKVGDYVYMKSDNSHLELAEIVFVEWHICCDNIVNRPTYGVNFIEGEHKGVDRYDIPESAIFCKFKGERLVLNEENS